MDNWRVDPSFDHYFDSRLKQVFFYITDRCQLRCEQCLYKTTLGNRDLPEDVAKRMLSLFSSYGAKKLTFIGGEPTLYDRKNDCSALFRLIEYAKNEGFQYIRVDTNGLFEKTLLENPSVSNLDNLAFSFDGTDPTTHELLRGPGTFKKSLGRLKQACEMGIYATITVCVHPGNVKEISEAVHFFEDMGVKEINFHPLFKMGIERDKFSGDTDIGIEEWRTAYFDLKARVLRGEFGIPVRASKRFVPKDDYRVDAKKYQYCPVRMGERILVHPNGEMRICALCIGSDRVISRWDQNGIDFERSADSEIAPTRLGVGTCLSQVKNFGNYSPLCISHKEGQEEYVWKNNKFGENLNARSEIPGLWKDEDLIEFWQESTNLDDKADRNMEDLSLVRKI